MTKLLPSICQFLISRYAHKLEPLARVEKAHSLLAMMKRLIAFDLDGTLAESKQALDDEMAAILARLSHVADICVISGMSFPIRGRETPFFPFRKRKRVRQRNKQHSF